MKARDALVIAGVGLGAFLAYRAYKLVSSGTVAGGAQAVTKAVGDAAAGVVKGIGSVVGVPDTNMAQCSADLAAGRWWDASFSCPLPVYAKAVAAKVTGSAPDHNPSSTETQAKLIASTYEGITPSVTVYGDNQSDAETKRLASANKTFVLQDAPQYDQLGNRIY